ncbi:uncharacterized protein LOC108858101 [Raphanus sativus]|uniref:Uncharacterized protein LOC108858101 n=1 Tax=Raphanus sativus TaxID=3726 RepID=A0A6J0NTX9_RAPSA|nr:uncharacterized protein LOC108858101 [Raphanus sativus]
MTTAAHCPRCKEVETAMHVFFKCPFAKEVWNQAPLAHSVHIADNQNLKASMVLFRTTSCLPPTGVRVPILPWICWFLWTARNKLIFENRTNSPMEVMTKAMAAAREWDQAQIIENPRMINSLPAQAHPRQRARSMATPVCFVDAAWNQSSKTAGVAWLITREGSIPPLSGSKIIENVSTPLTAEALALCNGLRQAIDLGLSSVIVYSDCATLIRAIVSKDQIKEIYGTLQDIKSLSAFFVSIVFQFVPRSQNRETDFIAKQALKAHCLSSFHLG